MIYGSVCSGIEAATVAWHLLGWHPAWFAEIDPFCSSLLKHHYSEVPNYGDFTKIESSEPIDLLVAGTPCQDDSVAGLRAGLDGSRGILKLKFAALAGRLRPRWILWEQPPGTLSLHEGRDFGIFIGKLVECGYGVCWRILDAQFAGVPQRRRRVFVVGYLGDWRRAAAVLFERASLSGNPAPSRATGKDVAGSLGGGSGERGWCDDTDRMTFVPETYRFQSFGEYTKSDHSSVLKHRDNKDAQDLVVFDYKQSGEVNPTIRSLSHDKSHANNGGHLAVAGTLRGEGFDASHNGDSGVTLIPRNGVRRLTPRECERLQGFPDDYTRIPYRGKPASDGPRYRALGNSMAVPVMRWIGERIAMVETLG